MKWPTIKINIITLWKLCKFFRKYVLGEKVPDRKYKLIRDSFDERDHAYMARRYADLPISTNRKNISEFIHRYDQGNAGSCCAFGGVEAFRRVLQVNKMPDFEPSALFAYYNLRTDKNRDCGGQIRDTFKAMNEFGICAEKTWPYILKMLTTLPSASSFSEGLEHQSITYERIYPATKEAIMDAISQGYPIVYGKDLFSSFESEFTKISGIVEMPTKCETMIGGHCMVIFDYDELGTVELNSWGAAWGHEGTAHFPWEYVLTEKWCNDFWVLYKSE